MKKKITCEIEYFKSPHLNQIYHGFDMLKKQGLINLKYNKSLGDPSKGFVKVIINKKHIAIYDALDGLNWVDKSLSENITYFSNIKADFYFKRYYTDKLKSYNNNLKLHPLGFNHYIDHKLTFNDSIKNIIKNSFLYKKLHPNKSELNHFFSGKPIIKNKNNKIIFFTRLWDPNEMVLDNHLKSERNSINNFRINVIKTCKKEFGDIFLGGLADESYSRKIAPELIASKKQTSKLNYLKNVEKSNICIATTGLHNSTGWKFAEYLASSRAIITQPLKHSCPGDFRAEENYLEFNNMDQLIEKIYSLLNNRELIEKIMTNNYNYYNKYLRSDKLILNSLIEMEKTFGNNV